MVTKGFRTTFFLIFAFSWVSVTQLYGQKFNKPVDYLNYISKEFKKVSQDMWDYTSSFSHKGKARIVEAKRKSLINQLTASINKISKMPDYEGNTSFRDSVISYLTLNMNLLNEDYAKIVDMEDIAEQSYDAMEAYLLAKERATDKLDISSQMLNIEESKFASSYGINLVDMENELSKKLNEASKVYKYYNEIYLIFFKSYKQEIYLIEAQSRGDFNAMEQNKNALAQSSVDGLRKISPVKDYKGDKSLKSACTEVLKFYELETTKYADITDYFLQKENFEKIKASFDTKRESQRTKQDIEQYNRAAKDFNAVVNKYNKTNAELNDNRSRLLTKWNNSVSAFTDRHVPKKK